MKSVAFEAPFLQHHVYVAWPYEAATQVNPNTDCSLLGQHDALGPIAQLNMGDVLLPGLRAHWLMAEPNKFAMATAVCCCGNFDQVAAKRRSTPRGDLSLRAPHVRCSCFIAARDDAILEKLHILFHHKE